MKQLKKTDRQEIELYLDKGHSHRSIAKMLKSPPSTIGDEGLLV